MRFQGQGSLISCSVQCTKLPKKVNLAFTDGEPGVFLDAPVPHEYPSNGSEKCDSRQLLIAIRIGNFIEGGGIARVPVDPKRFRGNLCRNALQFCAGSDIASGLILQQNSDAAFLTQLNGLLQVVYDLLVYGQRLSRPPKAENTEGIAIQKMGNFDGAFQTRRFVDCMSSSSFPG